MISTIIEIKPTDAFFCCSTSCATRDTGSSNGIGCCSKVDCTSTPCGIGAGLGIATCCGIPSRLIEVSTARSAILGIPWSCDVDGTGSASISGNSASTGASTENIKLANCKISPSCNSVSCSIFKSLINVPFEEFKS